VEANAAESDSLYFETRCARRPPTGRSNSTGSSESKRSVRSRLRTAATCFAPVAKISTMSTVILISFVLPTFFVRDWLLLRMGPAAAIVARLREYALVLLASIVLFSAITVAVGTERLLEIVLSPSVTLPIVLLYCVLLAVCIWIRRTDRHQVAWRIALFPNPVLVLAIATLARFILPRVSVFGAVVVTPLLACLWIGLIGLSVWGARNTPLDVPDLNFSLGLAGLVNSAVLLLLPLGAWIQGSAAWNNLFQQVGAMLSFD